MYNILCCESQLFGPKHEYLSSAKYRQFRRPHYYWAQIPYGPRLHNILSLWWKFVNGWVGDQLWLSAGSRPDVHHRECGDVSCRWCLLGIHLELLNTHWAPHPLTYLSSNTTPIRISKHFLLPTQWWLVNTIQCLSNLNRDESHLWFSGVFSTWVNTGVGWSSSVLLVTTVKWVFCLLTGVYPINHI